MTRHLEHDYKNALMGRASVEWPAHRFFSRTVALVQAEGRKFRAGIPGQADIYIVGRGGGHWELEIKRYTGLSEAQGRWRDWCISWGVPWMCVEARRSEAPGETIERWCKEIGPWLNSTT